MDRSTELFPGLPRKPLDYDVYRAIARDGDVFLWQPSSLIGRIIAHGTDGPFCHASLACRAHGRLFDAGYHLVSDGALVPLSGQVRRNPGLMHVFRVNDVQGAYRLTSNDFANVATRMVNSLSGDYALRNIRLITLAYVLPWLAWLPFYKRLVAQQARKHTSGICSQSVARAFRQGAGVVLSGDRQNEPLVSPNDLGRAFFKEGKAKYLGALSYPQEWAQ